MGIVLGQKSLQHLDQVEPRLRQCVLDAAGLSLQEFQVTEGLRSEVEQAENVAKGVSWTMDSKHLRQADGFAHAVDLVPMLRGTLRWEWPLVYPVAWAMQRASVSLGLRLRWGGVWDRPLGGLPESPAGLAQAVASYCTRHAGVDHLDGPHFELLSEAQP